MNGTSRLAVCLITLTLCDESLTARAAVQRYNILPGGQYSYLPSPMGPGIPGCSPSDFECDFGIAGQFSIEFDDTLHTAQFTDLDLALIGNEDIQNNPPFLAPITADRVEAWLAARVFEQEPVGAPINFYLDSQHPNLSLTDFLTGTVGLVGGYDHRLVDGDGLQFNLQATIIPEPCSLVLIGLATLGACTSTRMYHPMERAPSRRAGMVYD
jgi:hypothetical protein